MEWSGQKIETTGFLAKDEKSDEIEIKTSKGRLTIVLSIFVWVANLSDQQSSKKLVIKWRKRLIGGKLINALFNYMSLPKKYAYCICPYLSNKPIWLYISGK